MFIEFDRVTKRFGPTLASDSVTFSILPNSIHGIVGENGAGKSTIMKIFYGMYPRDSGDIRVNGKNTHFRSPAEAIKSGIGMVHQHFMLIPSLTVWENILLGDERSPFISETRAKQLLGNLLKESVQFSLNDRVHQLSVGQRQQVEILKLLYRRSEVLILDEPTAVLTPQETETFFLRLKKLKESGKTVLLITHKLSEILSLTDRVTVMRQGRVVASHETKALTQETLTRLIMGQDPKPLTGRKQTAGKPLLEFKKVSVRSRSTACSLAGVDFHVRSGEIFGIAGISGNGQEEITHALAGLVPIESGAIMFDGNELAGSTYSRRAQGIGLIPADRHEEGLIADFSLAENSILGHHRKDDFTHRHFFSKKKITDHCAAIIKGLDVRPASPELAIRYFSGGNQQKLIVGRELSHRPRLIIAAYPSRGVDIGATGRIHDELIRFRNEGAAVVLISSELEEIFAISDRIGVLAKGKMVSIVNSESTDAYHLGLSMMGT